MNPILQAAAVVVALGTLGGAGYALDERYAKIDDVQAQVGANSQAIHLMRIENAHRAGNDGLVRRLCDDFHRVHGWSPSLCR
jgi:hypothetical protein|tara:strand:+ start:4224 stop:4469 length:246 start_codon:yes stop_codon:yes gene_type:complete